MYIIFVLLKKKTNNMATRHRWSAEEKQVIRDNKHLTASIIQKRFLSHVTVKAVQRQKDYIRGETLPMNGQPFTQQEIAYILENINQPNCVLSPALKRRPDDVDRIVNKLRKEHNISAVRRSKKLQIPIPIPIELVSDQQTLGDIVLSYQNKNKYIALNIVIGNEYVSDTACHYLGWPQMLYNVYYKQTFVGTSLENNVWTTESWHGWHEKYEYKNISIITPLDYKTTVNTTLQLTRDISIIEKINSESFKVIRRIRFTGSVPSYTNDNNIVKQNILTNSQLIAAAAEYYVLNAVENYKGIVEEILPDEWGLGPNTINAINRAILKLINRDGFDMTHIKPNPTRLKTLCRVKTMIKCYTIASNETAIIGADIYNVLRGASNRLVYRY